mgnify:CR=1 FL=1
MLTRWLVTIAVILLTTTGGGDAYGAQADVPVSDAARKQFERGVAYLDQRPPEYRRAYAAFKSAYADSPSPKILGNLGLCAMMIERDGEAIDLYGQYLQKVSDITPAERRRIERDLAQLTARLVTVTLEVSPAGARISDERVDKAGGNIVNHYGPTSGTLRVQIGAAVWLEVSNVEQASWAGQMLRTMGVERC